MIGYVNTGNINRLGNGQMQIVFGQNHKPVIRYFGTSEKMKLSIQKLFVNK